MVKWVLLGVLVLGAVATAFGAGGDEPDADVPASPGEQAVDCTTIPRSHLDNMATGLKAKAKRAGAKILAGATVPVSGESQFNVHYLAAIRVGSGSDHDDVLIAVSKPGAAGGAAFALGDALDWFVYGEAAEPGSPVAVYRHDLLSSGAADDALSCLSD